MATTLGSSTSGDEALRAIESLVNLLGAVLNLTKVSANVDEPVLILIKSIGKLVE